MVYAGLFLRGVVVVGLVAMNVVHVASHAYYRMFMTGTAISAVWWWNSRTAARLDLPWAWVAYALGAGVGTVIGALLGRV